MRSLLHSEPNSQAPKQHLNKHVMTLRSNNEQRLEKRLPRLNEGNGQTMLLRVRPGPRADPILRYSLSVGPLVQILLAFLSQGDSRAGYLHQEARPTVQAMASFSVEGCQANLLVLVPYLLLGL